MCERASCFVDGGLAGLDVGQAVSLKGFDLDPIESAITNAAQAAQEAEGLALSILLRHLKKLCDMQLEKLSSN